MLGLILKKQWLEMYREGRLFWITLTILLLMFSVLLSSWQNHHQLVMQKQKVTELERQRWLNQGPKGPHSAAHYGVYVLKPDSLLSVLEPGLNSYQGHVVFLEAHKQNDTLFRPAQDALAIQRFGEFTPAFVLQNLLPLLIILFGYSMICGERESGTLKQLLACGAAPRKILMGKAAVLLSVVGIFLLPILLYIVVAAIMGGFVDWPRATILLLVYLVYSLIWVLLTLTISVFSANSRFSLIILLMIWGAMCLLIPKVAMEWSAHENVLNSSRLFQSQLESQVYTPQRLQAIEDFKKQTLRKHQVETVEELEFDWSGAQLQFSEQYANVIFDRLYGEREKTIQAQSEQYESVGLLTPFISVQMLSMGLAATDVLHHQQFSDAAEQHRRLMQEILNGDLMRHGHKTQGHYQVGKQLWEKIPTFNYQQPEWQQVLSFYSQSIVILSAWLIFILVVAGLAVKRLAREGQA